MTRPRTAALAVAAALAAAGCSFVPEFLRPAMPVDNAWPTSAKPAGARKAKETAWPAFFADPRLQGLIAAALEHNADLRIAVARVEEARALYGVVHADRFPTVNAVAGRNASRTPADLSATGKALSTQRYDTYLAVPSFELDFWGRVGSLDTASKASYLATEEARRAFRLSLIADVAGSYLVALELSERVELARATVAGRDESRKLIAKRRDVGIASDLDYLQADGVYLSARAELANLERQWIAAENYVVQIVGRVPSNLPVARPLAAQGIVADFAVDLPADVLLSRPDIMAAEQKLIAANANIGAARAAFLPKILLTATLGTASKALAGLFDAGSRSWSFQPVLTQPLFDMGRNAANADLAEVRKNIAVIEYEKAIQTAFREVADLLAAREKLVEQLAAQEDNEKAQLRRQQLAEARYHSGIASHLEVLDAQRDAFAVQQGTAQARRALLVSAAQLYKALGGGE